MLQSMYIVTIELNIGTLECTVKQFVFYLFRELPSPLGDRAII
jgi:hypothetical protein